jgi:hypothetical protein
MPAPSKKYALIACVIGEIAVAPTFAIAQGGVASDTSQQTCAGLLANAPDVQAIGPGPTNDSASTRTNNSRSGAAESVGSGQTGADTAGRVGAGQMPSNVAGPVGSTQTRSDTASFGIGGARSGKADVVLWVGVHADQVRFASQPHVRVRLCWGGDTLRVVQRTNIPSPVVAGTTYRNVYVAVELVGRLNGECLANAIGVGSRTGTAPPRTRAGANPPSGASATATAASASTCAFLGGNGGAGAQTSSPPTP